MCWPATLQSAGKWIIRSNWIGFKAFMGNNQMFSFVKNPPVTMIPVTPWRAVEEKLRLSSCPSGFAWCLHEVCAAATSVWPRPRQWLISPKCSQTHAFKWVWHEALKDTDSEEAETQPQWCSRPLHSVIGNTQLVLLLQIHLINSKASIDFLLLS